MFKVHEELHYTDDYSMDIKNAFNDTVNIHGSVHRNNILLYKSQQDAHVTEFILSDNCSIGFGCYYHPSSGAQTTVTTASGNRYIVLLSAVIVEELELI
jgi:hypothetical protein